MNQPRCGFLFYNKRVLNAIILVFLVLFSLHAVVLPQPQCVTLYCLANNMFVCRSHFSSVLNHRWLISYDKTNGMDMGDVTLRAWHHWLCGRKTSNAYSVILHLPSLKYSIFFNLFR